ncbi:DUF1761 family protein [Fulvivirgaceae bacterium PWU4]|uniref:DUF1761 family protein n=1 Tax=Chryseosolibacter histidini TaxID=2782349 RepID=A0AAP2GHT4_9BACT|nr:DUF1761 family protein [Chryseosolibacter histidini]MBT1696399.1 DUF1761 family protein [Chryseosolibacter histidini]
MSSFTNINYLAVVVATVVYYMIGFFWYTKLFGTVWRQQTGCLLSLDPNRRPAHSLGSLSQHGFIRSGLLFF